MVEILQRELIYLWYYFDVQIRQIFWYWVFGMALGSAVSVFLKDHIHSTFRALGQKKLGILGIVISSILGIASPLCMYGTIPIAASFSRSGVRDDWLAAFMMSSVLLNPQLIVYSAAWVEIVQDNAVLYRIDLQQSEDQVIEIEYEGRTNTIEIVNHQIHIVAAQCPDNTCVNMGWLDSSAPIVCLPNHLVIRFTNTNETIDVQAQ